MVSWRVLKIFISSEIFEKFRGSKTKEMTILKFLSDDN